MRYFLGRCLPRLDADAGGVAPGCNLGRVRPDQPSCREAPAEAPARHARRGLVRMFRPGALSAFLILVGPVAARADRGALSLELGAGGSIVNVRGPYATGAPSQIGTSWATSLGASYGLSNHLELTGRFFWEPPEQFVHNGATVSSPSGALTGSLTEHTQRFGALAGARYVFGYVWRFSAGADIGWSQRSFSKLDHFDVSTGAPRSYGLQLADTSQASFVFAPSVAVLWTGDHFAVGLAPRFEILTGSVSTWSVAIPLTLAWSWFL